MTKQRGDPCIALRLPPEEIQALRIMADDQRTTVSALIRDAIDKSLAWHAYAKPVTLEGQITIDDHA